MCVTLHAIYSQMFTPADASARNMFSTPRPMPSKIQHLLAQQFFYCSNKYLC